MNDERCIVATRNIKSILHLSSMMSIWTEGVPWYHQPHVSQQVDPGELSVIASHVLWYWTLLEKSSRERPLFSMAATHFPIMPISDLCAMQKASYNHLCFFISCILLVPRLFSLQVDHFSGCCSFDLCDFCHVLHPSKLCSISDPRAGDKSQAPPVCQWCDPFCLLVY